MCLCPAVGRGVAVRRGQGLPHARHGQLCNGPTAEQLSPSAKLVAPLGECALKKRGRKHQRRKEHEARSEKRQRDQRVRGGTVAAVLWQGRYFLQPTERTHWGRAKV